MSSPGEAPVVFVVDDDVSVRESLELLIRSAGWHPETFVSAEDFFRLSGTFPVDEPRAGVIADFTKSFVEKSGGLRPALTAGDIADSVHILARAMADSLGGDDIGDGTAIAKAVE